MSYEVKPNYVYSMWDRNTLIEQSPNRAFGYTVDSAVRLKAVNLVQSPAGLKMTQ